MANVISLNRTDTLFVVRRATGSLVWYGIIRCGEMWFAVVIWYGHVCWDVVWLGYLTTPEHFILQHQTTSHLTWPCSTTTPNHISQHLTMLYHHTKPHLTMPRHHVTLHLTMLYHHTKPHHTTCDHAISPSQTTSHPNFQWPFYNKQQGQNFECHL